jgi:L-asparaginase
LHNDADSLNRSKLWLHNDHRLGQLAADERPMKTVYLVTTGGTIEKTYSEQNGVVANASSIIDRYLRLFRLPDLEVDLAPFMNKDSLEMTDEDRVLLLGMVRAILRENPDRPYAGYGYHGGERPILEARPAGCRNSRREGSDGLQNLTESLLGVGIRLPRILHRHARPAFSCRSRFEGSPSATFVRK